jgi:hypothetical protein
LLSWQAWWHYWDWPTADEREDDRHTAGGTQQYCGGLLTAVTFGLSAAIYQSRISTYCALAAGGVAVHAVMALFAMIRLAP